MNADELFNKASNLYGEGYPAKDDFEKKSKQAQALHYVNKALAEEETAKGLGLKALILFQLEAYEGAKSSARRARRIDPLEWFANLAEMHLQMQLANEGGIISKLDHLSDSFRRNFDNSNPEQCWGRAESLIVASYAIMHVRPTGIFMKDWRETCIKALTLVKDKLGALSSDDEETEAMLREKEATASGYLALID